MQVDIEGLPDDAPELRLSALLDQYRELREKRLENETKSKQASAGLLIIGLQQRLLSSIEAFARTLRVHRATVQRQWDKAQRESSDDPSVHPAQLTLLSSSVDRDDDRATLSEDELQAEEDAQFEAASAASAITSGQERAAELFAQEQELLEQMTDVAETHRGRPDARIRKLFDWIRENMCPDLPGAGEQPSEPAAWNDTRVIIFTEWEATKRYLEQQIGAAIEHTDRASQRIAIFHGPTPLDKREEIKRAFNAPPQQTPRSLFDRNRRRPRRTEFAGPLLEPVSLRCSLESKPHGAAQRPHRP